MANMMKVGELAKEQKKAESKTECIFIMITDDDITEDDWKKLKETDVLLGHNWGLSEFYGETLTLRRAQCLGNTELPVDDSLLRGLGKRPLPAIRNCRLCQVPLKGHNCPHMIKGAKRSRMKVIHGWRHRLGSSEMQQ